MFSITILRSMQDLGGTTINPILHHTMVSNNINNPTQIKNNHCLSANATASLHKALCQTAPASDLILKAISQLMEQMTRMNARVDKIQDFFKTNVQPMTDKKCKQVFFLTNYHRRPHPTQGIKGPRQAKRIT